MDLRRQEREVILLTDESKETVAVRELLDERRVSYAEVNGSVGTPAPEYKRPTLLVRGTAFQGLRQIKAAINTNRHL